MPQVTLYDLPSTPPTKPWSLNPWKTRMILNYKGIDYKTEWVEYPDLAPTLKSLGSEPNNPNSSGYFMPYTSPALLFEDGTLMMDSWKIAQELEKRYPSPSLQMDDPIVLKIRDIVLLKPLTPLVIPQVPKLLNPSSEEYFQRTRKESFGMPLAEFMEKNGGEHCWEEMKQPAQELAGLLKKNGGPFFLGKTVSYADFILVSALQFLKRVDQSIFDRYVAQDPAFGAIYDASKEWLKKDD